MVLLLWTGAIRCDEMNHEKDKCGTVKLDII